MPINKEEVKKWYEIGRDFSSRYTFEQYWEKYEKECTCDSGVDIGYFSHQGIQRKGMYCKKCHQLLDYIPQYSEDDL